MCHTPFLNMNSYSIAFGYVILFLRYRFEVTTLAPFPFRHFGMPVTAHEENLLFASSLIISIWKWSSSTYALEQSFDLGHIMIIPRSTIPVESLKAFIWALRGWLTPVRLTVVADVTMHRITRVKAIVYKVSCLGPKVVYFTHIGNTCLTFPGWSGGTLAFSRTMPVTALPTTASFRAITGK